jgi:hypothetical protein
MSPVGIQYVWPVAPGTTTPSRSHWYESRTPTGDHVPGLAVSLESAYGVPVIVTVPGVTVDGDPGTAAVEADVTDVVT